MGNKATNETRTSIFDDDDDVGDLSDFAPKTATQDEEGRNSLPPKPTKEELKTIGEGAGFTSREPRQYRTGRDTQLNTRVKASCKKRFYDLADDLDVPLGEAMEIAIDLLEQSVKAHGKEDRKG